VSVEDDGPAQRVVVAPGLAFDPFGREIYVGCRARIALPGAGAALLVCVAYRERAARFMPAPVGVDGGAGGDGDDDSPATRIVETFQISLHATASDVALPIARVRRLRGRWEVDPRFRAARVRR
jgi:hypothetical protein